MSIFPTESSKFAGQLSMTHPGEKNRAARRRGPVTTTDIILNTLKTKKNRQPSGFWNYIFVRCTYIDDDKWASFLTVVKAQNTVDDPLLANYQAWSTIEDKEILDNASMLEASQYFQSQIETLKVEEQSPLYNPRYKFYIYVNLESIESVTNPLRAIEETGNFLILVFLEGNLHRGDGSHLINSQWTDDMIAEDGDGSFKIISAKILTEFYMEFLEDPNNWSLSPGARYSLPFIHGRHDFSDVEKLCKHPDPIGMDAYKMLKGIYGPKHYRSRMFSAEQARTARERLMGHEACWDFYPVGTARD